MAKAAKANQHRKWLALANRQKKLKAAKYNSVVMAKKSAIRRKPSRRKREGGGYREIMKTA